MCPRGVLRFNCHTSTQDCVCAKAEIPGVPGQSLLTALRDLQALRRSRNAEARPETKASSTPPKADTFTSMLSLCPHSVGLMSRPERISNRHTEGKESSVVPQGTWNTGSEVREP